MKKTAQGNRSKRVKISKLPTTLSPMHSLRVLFLAVSKMTRHNCLNNSPILIMTLVLMAMLLTTMSDMITTTSLS